MFHKIVDVTFLNGMTLEATFHDGKVIQYNMAALFGKYPQIHALEDPVLFKSGKMMGGYGIIWNDDLDIEAETIYEDGVVIRQREPANHLLSHAIAEARALAGMSQKQVSALAGMDQSDFSKIERGIANPSILTLERIAKAMGGSLVLRIDLEKHTIE